MLTVSPAASERLSQILVDEECPEDIAIRLVLEDNTITMALDHQAADDTTFEHDGRTVLLLDQQVAELLQEETLNVEDTPSGTILRLERGDDEDG